MKTIPTLFLLLFCCSVLQGQTNSQIAQVLWLNQNLNVTCEVHEQRPTNSDELPTRELSFIDSHGKHTTAIQTPDSFLSMYPLGEGGALLVTVWSGGSAYHVRVFTWENGKLYCVLDDGSKTFPEIVFDVTKSYDTFFFLNDCPGGPDDPANWITRCYRWHNKKMIPLKTVPAKTRFQILN